MEKAQGLFMWFLEKTGGPDTRDLDKEEAARNSEGIRLTVKDFFRLLISGLAQLISSTHD
jgi:hypothetical protein